MTSVVDTIHVIGWDEAKIITNESPKSRKLKEAIWVRREKEMPHSKKK